MFVHYVVIGCQVVPLAPYTDASATGGVSVCQTDRPGSVGCMNHEAQTEEKGKQR